MVMEVIDIVIKIEAVKHVIDVMVMAVVMEVMDIVVRSNL